MKNVFGVLGEAGQVTLIGLFIVFLGLVILIACIYIMAALFEKGKKKSASPVPAAAPTPAVAPAPAPVVEAGIAPEVVAAIAAAIAAMDGANKSLVVRSIRRASGWKRAARNEQVYRF